LPVPSAFGKSADRLFPGSSGAYHPGVTSPPLGTDSVHLAWPREATAIAEIQRRSWAQLLPPDKADAILALTTLEEMVAAWEHAILRPPRAEYRILVASTAAGRVAGFAVTRPSDDADAETTDGAIEAFVIDPPAQRRGHGSRLLQACVDTLRADGFQRVRCWVGTDQDALRALLTGAGWAADGAWREIGTDEETAAVVRLPQVRLHTDIRP
jgi:ribosomal protein S18 acetylase RimI-like enzyme